MLCRPRTLPAVVLLACFATSLNGTVFSDETAVSGTAPHQRIDAAVESIAIGPIAPVCNDADFLRRVWLDLAGVIPTPEQARAFLDDSRDDKRSRLIDELLNGPEFVRHMTTQLDVMLLERKSDKNVPEPDWERYLVESLIDRKPLDQLYRELLDPDPATPTAAAAKFLLNREAEPNAVTRDIGRLAFGMDLQCAQCHDHPLVGDYFQEDYYGLFAFVSRTGLFTDPASKKVRLSEKADGVVNFKSVFTGYSRDNALPRLPKGRTLFDEPQLTGGDEYRVKPQKNVPGIPAYSRREALAKLLADNRSFQRNLANRLWAILFGRGIVHPVDYHHSSNPPSNPELLAVLTELLSAEKFDVRNFLRHVVLSRTYQRTCDAPHPETVNFSDIAARAERLTRQQKSASEKIASLEAALTSAQAAFSDAVKHNDTLAPKLAEQRKILTAARDAHQKAVAGHAAAESGRKLASDQSTVLRDVLAQTETAATATPDSEDSVLIEAVSILKKHVATSQTGLESHQKKVADAATVVETAAATLNSAQTEYDTIAAAGRQPVELAALEHSMLNAEYAVSDSADDVKLIDRQLAICQLAADYTALIPDDPAKAQATWAALVQEWTINGQLGSLQPLTPEQLASGAMRATGMLDPQFASIKAKVEKTPPKMPEGASEAAQQRLISVAMQTGILDLQRTNVREFVRHYGGLPGEDFQATVNQALFLGNSSVVDGWLKPSGKNLTARLANSEDARTVADELFIAVLSRPPSDEERQDVEALWNVSPEERQRNLAELVWAMLSATEFRFNH